MTLKRFSVCYKGSRCSISANLEVVVRDTSALASSFLSCNFNFISRFCNKVAHLVVKYALSLYTPLTWVGDFPIWAQLEASSDLSFDS